ncbi:M-phase phosphoprotein 8 [Bufo gargarizans]|uniref:M-phase phosphoprotein 8 n=1 Tax=Bufo gargarizans TaxID=30331 RepID=UPI001CF22EC7|nr:M-phase phosphoprotein 8 [Bufo gargarizans]
MAEFAGHDGSGAVSKGGELENPGEGAESEQEDEEDVFEVESILDSKIEGGEVLYRVRWKGYDSEGDTWEPEAHLDDCKEVLLEFRRKQAESKQKATKKETLLKLSELFDAESDSDSQHSTKDEATQKKKLKEEEDKKQQDDTKKKSKSGKNKEKSKSEAEPSENQLVDTKSKRRLSETTEDHSSKKSKKEESKKSKKEDSKDGKVRNKEEHKEKKIKKAPELEQTDKPQSPEPEVNAGDISGEGLVDDGDKQGQDEVMKSQEMLVDAPEEQAATGPVDVETGNMKLKKKKKKHKKKAERVDDVKTMSIDESHMEKKSLLKKQKSVDKVKEASTAEKLPTPIQKTSRPSTEDKGRKSLEFLTENKEAKKSEPSKEKPKKKHDVEKDARKEPKVVKNTKEQKVVYDAFTISAEDREECMESTKKKEDTAFDYRLNSEDKMKDMKSTLKERRSTQDEADSWTFGTSEGDQEVMDTMCHLQESSGALDSRSHIMGVGMDLQLEWMTLEDFQRHLDGSDEIIPKDPISNSALKEAVKNSDYLTVKYALNSKESYNLDLVDASGMTLVMMAAAAGQDDILRLLIKKGAKINSRQRNGTTALIHATEKNHLTTVALLLEAGAFVNLQQVTGETALMKSCKKGNVDAVRLLIEHGADCNILTKHQNNALQFAKQSDNTVFELLNGHLQKLSRVVEDAIKDYFEDRLVVLEPVFPIACHRLCEGPDFSLDFNYKPPFNIPEESGILLFVFHANFFGMEVVVRLCGPCSVQAVVLNDKFQLPVFLDANFIYSFSPVPGANKLCIRLSEVPTAKVKLLICAYRVQPR